MARIGVIGLGAMGGRIAARLLGGNTVYGTNRTPSKADALIEQGMIWRDNPRQVAEAVDIVFSMVSDDTALTAVANGEDGIVAGLGPGQIYVDMSTVAPATATDLARRVQARGAQMISAPVSGTVTTAEEGALLVLAGGRSDAIDLVGPVLRRFGSEVVNVGTQAQALVLKLAINTNLAAQLLALGEGMALAEKAGINPSLTARVMADSAVGSPAVRGRAPLTLSLPEPPWFDIAAMHKDIRLALDAAKEHRLALSSADTVLAALESAAAQGYSHSDIAALYRTVRTHESQAAPAPSRS